MLLSIIIVSYNTKDLTLQTINSSLKNLRASDILKNQSEILIIDNNSQDQSVAEIRKLKQKSSIPMKIIAKNENLGFGKANNIGIKKSSGKYILLLNSDTIVRKDAFESMIERFENNSRSQDSITKLGILAATLLNKDLSIQPQGGHFPNIVNLFFHMSMLDDLPIIGKLLPTTQDTGINSSQLQHYQAKKSKNNDHLIELDWIGGTAMMIPRSVLNEIGMLDQNIFMYGEDTEICLRAKNHHYQVAIDPDAQIIHLKNQSSSSENAIRGEFMGYLYIFSKHHTAFKTELAKVLLQMGAIIRIFIFSTIAKDAQRKSIYTKVLKDISSK